MQMQDKIVINDYIEKDPLSKENIDKTLETVDRFRLSLPNKSIWIYSGYKFEDVMLPLMVNKIPTEEEDKRIQIIKQCTVMVDGRYIDSQRDISLHWRGSSNQKVISIQESLKQQKVVTIE